MSSAQLATLSCSGLQAQASNVNDAIGVAIPSTQESQLQFIVSMNISNRLATSPILDQPRRLWWSHRRPEVCGACLDPSHIKEDCPRLVRYYAERKIIMNYKLYKLFVLKKAIDLGETMDSSDSLHLYVAVMGWIDTGPKFIDRAGDFKSGGITQSVLCLGDKSNAPVVGTQMPVEVVRSAHHA